MAKVVLLSAPYLIPAIKRFQPLFDRYQIELLVPQVDERLEAEEILAMAGKFDGAITGDDRFNAEVLEVCSPRLKVISKWGTGIDSIDKQAAEKMGISVRNTPGAFTEPVADSVMAYVLAFARQSPWLDKDLKSGGWKKIPGRSLGECTLGVIGVGAIGKAVLRRAKPFGMRLLGNDVVDIDKAFLEETGAQMTNFDTLLKEADFISLNCDLNESSEHIINEKSLTKLGPKTVIINTARGPLINEEALIAALQDDRVAGAALDVFESEPLPKDSPLRSMENVMLASHNANSSPAAWERVHWNTIRNLLDGLGIDHKDLREEDYPA
jgi:D-3-phosphoglycerate dehydrogenase